MERKIHVYAINPKQLDRLRDRYTMAGAKSDPLDAFVLEEGVGNDRVLYRRLEPEDASVVELREASRTGGELTEQRVQQANRLRELLYRFFPSLLTLCPAADDPWLWSLLELAPTPEKARKLSRSRLQKVLQKHRIRRIDGAELERVIQQPHVHVAPGVTEACARHIEVLVPQLRLLEQLTAENDKRLKGLLEHLSQAREPEAEGKESKHRDAEIVLSLPGVGLQIGATMLAEAPQPLLERDYNTLRALCGAAPVTRRSGKTKHVVMRRACNSRLSQAAYHLGRTAMQADPHAKALYAAHQARGQSHGRSVRAVADRHLAVLIACLRNGELYDPNHVRRGSQPAHPKAA
jgi:transposase